MPQKRQKRKDKGNSTTSVLTPRVRLIAAINELKETKLTLEVIMPLLSKLGYQRVDHTGGVLEEGKDIICYSNDRFNNTQYTTVQVKRMQSGGAASTSGTLSELLIQLSQAAEKRIPTLEGAEVLPDEVLFITPTVIDTRSLKARFEEYEALRKRNLKIIEGDKLAELIEQYIPEVCLKLATSTTSIARLSSKLLSNHALMSAIGSQRRPQIQDFYLDVDFIFGTDFDLDFLNGDFNTCLFEFDLSEPQWNSMKRIGEVLERNYGRELVQIDVAGVEREWQENVRAFGALTGVSLSFEKAQKKLMELVNLFHNWVSTFDAQHEENEKLRDRLRVRHDEIEQKISDLMARSIPVDQSLLNERIDVEARRAQLGTTAVNSIMMHTILKVLRRVAPPDYESPQIGLLETWKPVLKSGAKECSIDSPPDLLGLVESAFAQIEIIKDCRSKLSQITGFDPVTPVRVKVDATELIGLLQKKQNSLVELSRISLTKCVEFKDVREIINQGREISSVLSLIASVPRFAVAVLNQNDRSESKKRVTRFRIPISDLVSCNEDLFILGDAGAGKSTALQMVALQNLEREKLGTANLSIYVPLGQIAGLVRDANATVQQPFELFLNAFVAFLQQSGWYESTVILVRQLLNQGCLLLLDGIDEATRRIPWIEKAIVELKANHRNTQLVTTSRLIGGVSPRLPFTTIRLLPFDDEQQEVFVSKWLSSNSPARDRLLEHIRRSHDVREVARNPLLATVLCELAQEERDLPSCELQLYDERFDLLTGTYDSFKRIPQRIRQRRRELQSVAQKVAWYFHKNNMRQMPIDRIGQAIQNSLLISLPEIQNAIDDLVEACEILVPMDGRCNFGFGHLRFQEHLVARELRARQWEEVYSLLGDKWWSGPIFLYLSQPENPVDFVEYCRMRNGKQSPQWEYLRPIIAKLPAACRVLIGDHFDDHALKKPKFLRESEGPLNLELNLEVEIDHLNEIDRWK